MYFDLIKLTIFRNNRKKTGFPTKSGLVFVHGEVFKMNPGPLPHLRKSSLQQLLAVKSCKGLHLTCEKVLGSAPDFYVSGYIESVLTLNKSLKNKGVFNKRQTRCFLANNFA